MSIRLGELVGRPYIEDGREATDAGLDCYGVLRVALGHLGADVPREQAEALAAESALGRELAAGEPTREGDVLVFRAERGPHVGVALSPFRFVHATREAGVVVDRLAVWARGRLVRRVRVRALEGGSR